MFICLNQMKIPFVLGCSAIPMYETKTKKLPIVDDFSSFSFTRFSYSFKNSIYCSQISKNSCWTAHRWNVLTRAEMLSSFDIELSLFIVLIRLQIYYKTKISMKILQFHDFNSFHEILHTFWHKDVVFVRRICMFSDTA